MLTGENPYRIALLIVAIVQGSVSFYYMKRAGAAATILRRREEGVFITVPLVLSYLAYCAGAVIYLLQPGWMAWSAISLIPWIRWAGFAVLLLGVALIVWGLHALGTNLTLTPTTKDDHTLVTSGPYRWMRHPLYTAFVIEVVGIGLLTANWFVALTGLLTWIMLAIRTPREEESLIAKFGDEYRAYMQQVGRFFPKMNRMP